MLFLQHGISALSKINVILHFLSHNYGRYGAWKKMLGVTFESQTAARVRCLLFNTAVAIELRIAPSEIYATGRPRMNT